MGKIPHQERPPPVKKNDPHIKNDPPCFISADLFKYLTFLLASTIWFGCLKMGMGA